jgi:ubiquinone/menaquinone biosynthesis C-methylase UbiE
MLGALAIGFPLCGLVQPNTSGGRAMKQIQPSQPSGYALGHAEDELDRIINVARYFGDLTEHVLHLAGLAPGMRVLDVGCGPGDVVFLAARLVGPEGTVIGVDKSPEAIELAQQRADAAGLTNVQFVAQDLSDAELVLDEPVDALIGRLVLQYFADPALVLRRLATLVKPGGLVAFQEADMKDGVYSEPVCPVYETAIQRIAQTFTRIGADPRTGQRLSQVFQEAGLPAPQMILHSRVEHGSDSPIYTLVAQNTRVMLPLIQRTGVATAEEVGVETLAERMREEAVALDATLVVPPWIGAWTRTPLTKQ